MLTYPIDVAATAGRWFLFDTQTQLLSKMSGGSGNWPNGDGAEIQGLPAHLVPLLAVEDARPAEIDERLVRLVGQPGPPDLGANEIRTAWQIVPRDVTEKKDVVANIETTEFGKHLDPNAAILEIVIVLGGILRQNKNLNVPTALKDISDSFMAKSEKLYKNRLKVKAMLAAIDAGQTPVLDQTFEPV